MPADTPTTLRSDLLAWLADMSSGESAVTGDATLEQLGLDSLALVDLSRELRRRGIEVEPMEFDFYSTVDEVLSLVESRAGAGRDRA